MKVDLNLIYLYANSLNDNTDLESRVPSEMFILAVKDSDKF